YFQRPTYGQTLLPLILEALANDPQKLQIIVKTILITGGAGFIGSALVRMLVRDTDYHVVNVDKLTYAGNLQSLAEAYEAPAHCFVKGDICDATLLRSVFERHAPVGVIHLAAESHVDRSIDAPGEFVATNVVGTFAVLQESLRYWRELPADR